MGVLASGGLRTWHEVEDLLSPRWIRGVQARTVYKHLRFQAQNKLDWDLGVLATIPGVDAAVFVDALAEEEGGGEEFMPRFLVRQRVRQLGIACINAWVKGATSDKTATPGLLQKASDILRELEEDGGVIWAGAEMCQQVKAQLDRTDGVKTGLYGLDDLIGGFLPGELVVVGGISSHGKSALVLSFAAAALDQGHKVLYADYEMGKELTLARMTCHKHRLKITDVLRKRGSAEDDGQADAAFKAFGLNGGARLGILEHAPMGRLIRIAKQEQPAMIVVDYIQNMATQEARRGDDVNPEITRLMGQLKELGNRQKCIIVVVSQVLKSTRKKPSKQDLLGSGGILNIPSRKRGFARSSSQMMPKAASSTTRSAK